jgi:hypothetical protein
MLSSKFAHLFIKLALGKEAAIAITLLRLIYDATRNHNIDNIASFVYTKLPPDWRAPNGPATEAEFITLIQSGQTFLSKTKSLFT